MARYIFVLLFAGLLAVEANSTKIKILKTKLSNVNPRGIMDEAQDQLEELKSIVQDAISTAENDLGDLGLDFGSYSANIVDSSEAALIQQEEMIDGELGVIKSLAGHNGLDISACLDIREQVLHRMPVEYFGEVKECISGTTQDSKQVLQDTGYFVDVYINKVNDLEFQLNQCTTDSILCISPVVSLIELGMVQLPQGITVEVDRATDLLETLKPTVQDCSSNKVAEYAVESHSILGDISACISRLP